MNPLPPPGRRSFLPLSRLGLACLLTLALGLSGCRSLWAKKRAGDAPLEPLRLGRVALVNEEEHFALIEMFATAPPATGTTLRIYRGAAVSAELRATAVRRRPFLVADLVGGEAAKGDIVFQPRGESPTAPRAEPAATPSPPATPPPRVPAWRRWLHLK